MPYHSPTAALQSFERGSRVTVDYLLNSRLGLSGQGFGLERRGKLEGLWLQLILYELRLLAMKRRGHFAADRLRGPR